MNKRYFEVSAKHMKNFGIEGARVFEVIDVETNMIGGKGFDAFLTLDTPAMLEDCFIGKNLVVAAARGRFVDAPAEDKLPTVEDRAQAHAAIIERQRARLAANPEQVADIEAVARLHGEDFAEQIASTNALPPLPKGGGLLGASVRQMIVEHRAAREIPQYDEEGYPNMQCVNPVPGAHY